MLVGRRIDREAWAREMNSLMLRFDPGNRGEGNKSAFALRIGFTRQTLQRWLDQKTDITHDSVRQVFDRLQLVSQEQRDILARVGYLPDSLSAPELPEPPAIPDPYQDKVIQQILANETLTKEQRDELVEEQLDRIEADLERRQEEYQRQLRRLEARRAAS
jgi:hypothetical protein